MTLDPERVKVDKNKLVFQNVSELDKMTIQCNSTNKHGYIYENAYLNIQSELGARIHHDHTRTLQLHTL